MTETPNASDPAPRPSFTAEARRCVPAGNWGWFLFRGLLALALGVLAILYPFSAVTAFALLFAVFAFVDGVSLLISGIVGASNDQERWWWLVLAGLAGIAVGAIYIAWPGLSTVGYALVLLVLVAIWAIANGIAQIGAAIRLRREIEGEWLLGLAGVFSLLLGIAILLVTAVVPGASILSVGWMIGIYALIAGAALIALGLRLRARA